MITSSDRWGDRPLCRLQYIFTHVYSWIEREPSIRRYCSQAMGMKKRRSYCYIDYTNLVVFNRVHNLQSIDRDTTRYDNHTSCNPRHQVRYQTYRPHRTGLNRTIQKVLLYSTPLCLQAHIRSHTHAQPQPQPNLQIRFHLCKENSTVQYHNTGTGRKVFPAQNDIQIGLCCSARCRSSHDG